MRSLDSGTQDSHRAEQALRALGFSQFHEQVFSDRKLGITLAGFDGEVQNLAKSYHFPDHVTKLFHHAKHAETSAVYVKEFKFHLGQGRILHGAFATMRKQNLIDMAYSFYRLDFHLTPERIEHVHKKAKRILGIKVGTKKKVTVQYRERQLSENDLRAYDAYFRSKAANGYRNKFIQGQDEL